MGTTPCDSLSREFLGGLATNAPCHCITWDLKFFAAENPGQQGRFDLVVRYGLPGRDDPNQLEEGPMVELQGRWDVAKGTKANANAKVYRIYRDNLDKPLSLVKATEHLLHFLDSDKSFRIGNAGWSYTLNRKGVGSEN